MVEDHHAGETRSPAEPPANAAPEDVASARKLLDEGVYAVAQFCGLDDDDTLPGSDGLPGVRKVTDARWEKIKDTRRELALLFSRMAVE